MKKDYKKRFVIQLFLIIIVFSLFVMGDQISTFTNGLSSEELNFTIDETIIRFLDVPIYTDTINFTMNINLTKILQKEIIGINYSWNFTDGGLSDKIQNLTIVNHGMTLLNGTGRFDDAYFGNVSNSSAYLNFTKTLFDSNNFTISAWFKIENVSATSGTLFLQQNPAGAATLDVYVIRVINTKPRVRVVSTVDYVLDGNCTLKNDTFFHLAVTTQETTATNQLWKIYVDGDECGIGTDVSNHHPQEMKGQTTMGNSDHSDTDLPLQNVAVDEIKYWNRTLNHSEIQEMIKVLTVKFDIGDVDSTPEWNQSIVSEQSIAVNISVINNIIGDACICTDCTLSSNICSIPFNFFSDTIASLEYSNINLTMFTNLTVNVFNRETNTFITDTTNIQIKDFGNSTTTTGTISINFSTEPGPHTIIASSANYITDQNQFTLTDRASTVVNMYLLNTTSDDVGNLIVNVFDEFFNYIVGANVKLLEYDTDTDSFIEVSQCFSNSNGECIFNVELDTKFYIVQATHERNGLTLFAQSTENGEILKIDNTIIELHMRTSETFEVNDLFGFQINVTNTDLVSNTSFLTATFNDLQNVNHTVCVAYYQRRNVNDIELESTCITASAGIVNQAGGYALDRTITNVAKVYVADDGKQRIYAEFVYVAEEGSFSNAFGVLTKYVVLGILLALLALALWAKNMGIFGFGGIGLSLLIPFFDPSLIGAVTTVFIIILCILIISMAQQRKQ